VFDLADAHIKGLEYLEGKKESDSFNLGNDRGHSVREVVDTVRRKAGKNFKVIESERREGDPPVLISDSKKAKEILGWAPRYNSLETIVETALHWHKKEK
jgi:UDP-glucose 4-epimerase